ncbi:MAG: hypothetical protein IKS54_06045 [Erysipelotrichaceae bacterium]|nr:hypothetical protein [Erysipelotrichaceae bacterium]
MSRKKNKKKKALIFVLLFLILAASGALGYLVYRNIQDNKTEPYYLAADRPQILLRDKDGNERNFVRGQSVDIKNKRITVDEKEYCQFVIDDVTYLVSENDLTKDRRDCVRETKVYALRDHVLNPECGDFHIAGWVLKGSGLSVTGYHELRQDGTIDYYYVNNTGYIDDRHVSLEYYETALDPSRYSDLFYGEGGSPLEVDYYPKESFDAKRSMPEKVNALYINAEAIVDADSYIELAKQCPGINAFVVDVKDCYIDTQLAYESPVGKQYAPSTYNIPNSYDAYQNNVRKLKDAGYYLIGRITAFKDDSFALDNPDEALMYDGRLYNYGSVKWPSIFSRKMWEYNVALALEAANEMGFDEIQFDYVRLPEDVEDVELRNSYDETRAQAVTNFLRYATECLHEEGIYVSADVFGETSGDDDTRFSCFVSYYGQFWPAISNVVDAISSMPYPDHFASYAYGIPAPWSEPGELMYSWGRATYYAQENTYDPAKCRTWIMAQNSDPYDVYYGADFIEAQIAGLRNAGVDDGYLTWNAASSINKYYSYTDVLD